MNNAAFMTKYIENDEAYTTKAEADKLIDYLIKNNVINKDMIIWLPFDNDFSNIYRSLNNKGFNTVLSNLELGLDFFLYKPDKWDIIITNPPFANRTQLMNRLLMFDKPFIILQGTQYFQNQFAVDYLCSFSNEFKFIFPRTRMNFLRYDKNTNLIKASKGGAAYYSFWLCYKVELANAFNSLPDNGREKQPESYQVYGNTIVDNHKDLFSVEVGNYENT